MELGMQLFKLYRACLIVMKRSFNYSPESPPPMRLEWGNEEPDSPRAREESLECKEEMPSPESKEPGNLKRKRVLPPMFSRLPENGDNNEHNCETESDDSYDDREALARMQLAVQLWYAELARR